MSAVRSSVADMHGRPISERDAARILAEAGLPRRHALRVLHAGFAGPPYRTRNRVLYDEDRVEALAARDHVEPEVLVRARETTGLFIGRRDIDIMQPEEIQREAAARAWDIGRGPRIISSHWIRTRAPLPFVATVAGFVALGAEIVALTPDRAGGQAVNGQSPGGLTRLVLQPPGAWFGDYADRRLVTGRGRPALIVGWQPHVEEARRVGSG